jgi:two-component sensor histidine kinase
MSETSQTTPRPAPEAAEDELLLYRARLAAKIVIAGIAACIVPPFLLWPGHHYGITLVQVANLIAVAVILRLQRPPSFRQENLALAFVAYTVTAVSVGLVGVLARDQTTPVIVLVAMILGVAALLPWGPRWQFRALVVTVGVAIWTVATLVDAPRHFWVQNIGSLLPTLVASVLISYVFGRERALVVRTQHQHEVREARLSEVNVKLEREIQEHRRTEEALRFALRELDHRVKNTLATVQSVAQHTLDSSASPEEFAKAFHGRIQAMARIHGALATRRWEGLDVRELIELVVGPFRGRPDSVAVECDGGRVPAELVRALGMALHELATNAAKYGALSTSEGRVNVISTIQPNGSSRLRIQWRESNGPAVGEPPRRGLGTKLIEEALAYESGARVSLRFDPAGLRCEFDIPLPERRGEGLQG